MAATLLKLIKDRRTYYPLSKDLTIPASRIEEIVGQLITDVPSSFNSQSNRAVLLLGAEHDKLWDITSDALRAVVPEENWKPTGDKLALFKGGAGTVLFFVDEEPVKELQKNFALYADKFPVWADQSLGMLQFAVWTALEAEGLGANLQHYNPLPDAKIAETWKIPASWKLNAQLVFGGRTGEAGPKESKPVSEVFKVHSS
ncbi:putative nitroreductase HBN1 [Scedosporium apiospermum]|uniref:Putative nitroreductase HBN1 n=1 Tax=Pseudallescheria apiosperma TaxID=563466 RepID=A0A084GH84_PSEDA|nr:putative nitroreductase HBN1 [Scedosporium apiospermum]KEZ46696.1 putative nitroreductase HBN1 [Scedosporium apiospermum]